MKDAINRFRNSYGVEDIEYFDEQMSEYCKRHCFSMSKAGYLYHTEPCYLENMWEEAVAFCDYLGEPHNQIIDKLLFDVLDQEHKSMLLERKVFAGYLHTDNWHAYLTIRGK